MANYTDANDDSPQGLLVTRGRKPLVSPTRGLHIHIDAKLAEAIDARLFSEAEGRVPKGAYQEFFTEAAVRLMRQQPFDLSPFAGSLPTEHVVYAFPGTKEVLHRLLAWVPTEDRKPV